MSARIDDPLAALRVAQIVVGRSQQRQHLFHERTLDYLTVLLQRNVIKVEFARFVAELLGSKEPTRLCYFLEPSEAHRVVECFFALHLPLRPRCQLEQISKTKSAKLVYDAPTNTLYVTSQLHFDSLLMRLLFFKTGYVAVPAWLAFVLYYLALVGDCDMPILEAVHVASVPLVCGLLDVSLRPIVSSNKTRDLYRRLCFDRPLCGLSALVKPHESL